MWGNLYILTEKVYYSLGDDVGYIKDKEVEYIRAKDMIIQYLLKNDSINNTKVRELCGCDDRKAKHYLDKMVEESIIKPKGEKRWRVYVLKFVDRLLIANLKINFYNAFDIMYISRKMRNKWGFYDEYIHRLFSDNL